MEVKSCRSDSLFKLNPLFIMSLFEKLASKFGNSRKASEFLQIPYPSFRGYKNGYFSSIPENLIKRVLRTQIISKNEIQENTLTIYSRSEQIKAAMGKGKKLRNKKLKKWKQKIPKLNKIFINNYLDFEKWFLNYQRLVNFGVRKFNYIKKDKRILEVSYTTHSNKIKKEFILKFPRKIIMDENFIYFFGLWVGDKAGGGRLGVMNKEEKLISFSEKYLKYLHQNTEKFMYIGIKEKLPKNIKYDKIYWIKQKEKGYSLSIHSTNGIFRSFFNYLESNLNEFLHSIKNSNIFFAGLFDAEGNIFLEDSCFRWACKNDKLKKVFTEHLKKLDLFKRYDGVNFVTDNKKKFLEIIFPYIKHPKKINNSSLVLHKKGKLEKRFADILKIVKEQEGITAKELSKRLNKKKIYLQVNFLKGLNYLYVKDYPQKIFINKSLGES